jgi:hypothetical protein
LLYFLGGRHTFMFWWVSIHYSSVAVVFLSQTVNSEAVLFALM